jgi:hypothetical protein
MHCSMNPGTGQRSGLPFGRTLLSLLIVAAAVIAGGVVLGRGPRPTHLGFGGVLGQGTSEAVACDARSYPAGAAYTFERCTSSGAGVGWARCSVVTYSVDPAGAPLRYRADLDRAITQLRTATGLHLISTSGAADIAVSWDPSLYQPRPGTTGEAGVTAYQMVSGSSAAHLSSASVRISSHLAAGTARSVGEEPVLLHELGHAVGLGHDAGAVVMNPVVTGFATYQAGDLSGLAALYRPGSCHH